MLWVIVMAAIALAGLVMVVCYAVWLAHKAADVFAELGVLGTRLGQLAELAAQVRIPEPKLEAADIGWRDASVVGSSDVR